MNVSKKVVGTKDLVVEISQREFIGIESEATLELLEDFEKVGGEKANAELKSMLFMTLTLFCSKLTAKLYGDSDEGDGE